MGLTKGTVLGLDGRAVPEAFVAVEWGTAPTPEIAILTDETGKFRLFLPAGTFRVGAHAVDGRSGTAEISCGDEPGEMEIRIS